MEKTNVDFWLKKVSIQSIHHLLTNIPNECYFCEALGATPEAFFIEGSSYFVLNKYFVRIHVNVIFSNPITSYLTCQWNVVE